MKFSSNVGNLIYEMNCYDFFIQDFVKLYINQLGLCMLCLLSLFFGGDQFLHLISEKKIERLQFTFSIFITL